MRTRIDIGCRPLPYSRWQVARTHPDSNVTALGIAVISSMNTALDEDFKRGGVYFLPWIGDNYEQGFHDRRFLVLGESHYSYWEDEDGQTRHHPPRETWTRDFVSEVTVRDGCALFWKNIEQALLNEQRINRWCPSGGLALWNKLAFYNFVQSALERPGKRPTSRQFDESREGFRTVLEVLSPERVLVCGMELWNKGMDCTDSQLHDRVQAYRLADGKLVWCLAIKHPSRFFSWRPAHNLIRAFLNDPHEAATLLSAEQQSQSFRLSSTLTPS